MNRIADLKRVQQPSGLAKAIAEELGRAELSWTELKIQRSRVKSGLKRREELA